MQTYRLRRQVPPRAVTREQAAGQVPKVIRLRPIAMVLRT